MTTTLDPFEQVVPDDLPIARTRLRGTAQQEAFWSALQDEGGGHVILEARAGTGKSTSCREAMWRLLEDDGSLAIRYCCFNRSIADEFRAKAPRGVDVGTMHSFGLRALGRAAGAKIEGQRSYLVMDAIGGKQSRSERKATATLVSLAKNHALRPDQPELESALFDLIDHYQVETWGRTGRVVELATKVLDQSAASATLIDFDDMLWLPVLMGLDFPGLDFLFIDEAQDLNPVQHALAERLAGSGRTVIVGDPRQAIYGFRGADTDSIPKLRERLGAQTLPLTVTFRCPQSHVALARKIVPDFEAAPSNPEGTIARPGVEGVEQLAGPGDLVLCRAKAPLVKTCLSFVRQRRRAVMRGRAFGDQLGTLARRWLDSSATVADFAIALRRWRDSELAKLESREGCEDLIEQVQDKADCLDAIAGSCAATPEIPEAIRQLFDDQADPARFTTFSTVHRAKGSEARRVFFVDVPYSEARDKKRPPSPWELRQRENLRYVALTRSLNSLYFVPPSDNGQRS